MIHQMTGSKLPSREWKGILKNKNKTNQTLKQKEQLFGDSMNDLFDIAHQDSLNMISIQEDKLFLVKQREKERTAADEYSTESEPEYMDESFEIDQQQEIAAAFDKCKISERDAVHLLVAFLEAVSLDPSDYIINRTSIRNARAVYRESYDKKLKQSFTNLNVKSVVVHWDTKIIENISGKFVDRLAVIATGTNFQQLLGIPEVSAGTGLEISSAVFDTLKSWALLDKTQAFVFDMIASNTGPDIPLFKRFKTKWNTTNLNKFVTGISNIDIKIALGNNYIDILNYAKLKLSSNLNRDDYKELLDLIIIFLGEVPPGGIKFKKPGA
ncbi:hypothetical protein AGLY_007978 [Aphis glycines]|uniref:Uncharacterized protein n=1 Tax=Aphis glycines TaxID=307491 RepID=A0A6G0TN37_APHGL|nr:hypothetical protein AGLY_007978 [Aphis glycines]